jgi:hypothetical protein
MGTGFNVNTSEIRGHAETVGAVAGQVRAASGSAQDSIGGGAFGQIGEFFASAITGAAEELRSGITTAGQTVEQVQQGLTTVVDGYQSMDDQRGQVFGGIQAGQVRT